MKHLQDEAFIDTWLNLISDVITKRGAIEEALFLTTRHQSLQVTSDIDSGRMSYWNHEEKIQLVTFYHGPQIFPKGEPEHGELWMLSSHVYMASQTNDIQFEPFFSSMGGGKRERERRIGQSTKGFILESPSWQPLPPLFQLVEQHQHHFHRRTELGTNIYALREVLEPLQLGGAIREDGRVIVLPTNG
jgi:hypothetical protein